MINQMISGGISQAELDSLLEAESKLVEAVAEVQFLLIFHIVNDGPSLTTLICMALLIVEPFLGGVKAG